MIFSLSISTFPYLEKFSKYLHAIVQSASFFISRRSISKNVSPFKTYAYSSSMYSIAFLMQPPVPSGSSSNE